MLKTETIDVTLLLKSLQLTMEFEAQLNKRFDKQVSGLSMQRVSRTFALMISSKRKQVDGKSVPMFRFTKSISQAFQPYLWIYIEAEDK